MVKRLHKELVSIRYNAKLKEIKGKYRSEKVASVNNKTGAEEMPIDWVVICVVAEPDTELARKMGLEMTKGFVKVDGQMKTSKKGIFACGKLIPGPSHLINSTAGGSISRNGYR